jgi:hypothetical protein
MTEKSYLNPKEAKQYLENLGIPMSTSALQLKRKARDSNPQGNPSDIGPAFHRFGSRTIRYTKSSLDAWIASCGTEPVETSEETPQENQTQTVTPDF